MLEISPREKAHTRFCGIAKQLGQACKALEIIRRTRAGISRTVQAFWDCISLGAIVISSQGYSFSLPPVKGFLTSASIHFFSFG